MLEVLGYIVLTPLAVAAAGLTLALLVGIVKGIGKAFKK